MALARVRMSVAVSPDDDSHMHSGGPVWPLGSGEGARVTWLPSFPMILTLVATWALSLPALNGPKGGA